MMDFTENLHIWVKGEALQGRVMIITGLLMLLVLVSIIRGEDTTLKGMAIPLGILIAMNLGYGYNLVRRPYTSKKIEISFQQNPRQTIYEEHKKSAKGAVSYYTPFTKVWAAMVILTLILYFVFNSEYMKGLSTGLAIMFLGMFLIDTFLHNRLKKYIESLETLLHTQ